MITSTLTDLEQKLTRHFIELDHYYLTLQNDRGDKYLDNVKKAFNLSYSKLNTLYKLHQSRQPKK